MEPYENSPARNLALDYTSLKNEEKLEAAVLDLSCKKEQLQDNSCNLSPVSLEARSVSPSSESTNEQHHYHHHHNNYHKHHHQKQEQQQQAQIEQNHRHHYYHDFHSHHSSEEDEQKSPESRTYMVTPPSDSESPKKSEYPTVLPQHRQEIPPKADLAHHYPPQLSVNIPVTHPVPHPEIPVQHNSIPYPEVLAPANLLTMNMSKLPEHQVASPDAGKKAPRPFKAYPKDPLSLTVGPPEFIYDQNSKEAYNEFRKRMLESVRKTNDGTNIKMRRLSKNSNLPTSTIDDKDMAYWERRRKNNEAAKRSRDARRAKEDEIAIRAAYLEQENIKLKYEILALRNETARLRCMVYPN